MESVSHAVPPSQRMSRRYRNQDPDFAIEYDKEQMNSEKIILSRCYVPLNNLEHSVEFVNNFKRLDIKSDSKRSSRIFRGSGSAFCYL